MSNIWKTHCHVRYVFLTTRLQHSTGRIISYWSTALIISIYQYFYINSGYGSSLPLYMHKPFSISRVDIYRNLAISEQNFLMLSTDFQLHSDFDPLIRFSTLQVTFIQINHCYMGEKTFVVEGTSKEDQLVSSYLYNTLNNLVHFNKWFAIGLLQNTWAST